MPEITAEQIREVRNRTGAGLQECKAALQAKAGDSEAAAALLQERRTGGETLSSISIRLSIICPSCNSLIAVNSAYQAVQCPDCGSKKNLKDTYGWHRLLDLGGRDVFQWAVRNTNRKTETGSIYSIKLEAGRGWPNCFSCKKQFKEDIVKRVALAGTELHCQQCDRGIPVLPAPRHLSKPFRCARYIVARNDWRQGIPEAYEKISPPRAFHCASCGAPLPGSISGGMVACSFCKTDNLLSDYMEFRKKAFARATSWYILFDPSLIRS